MKTKTGSQSKRVRHDDCLAAAFILAAVVSNVLGASHAMGGPLFQAPYIGIPGAGGADVAIVDVNRDGRLDIVSPFAVTLGNGDGTFAPAVAHDHGVNGYSVAIGDLDADGRLDLVTPDAGDDQKAGSTVVVVLGNGDGTFASKSEWPTGLGPSAVAIGDLNRDGKPDLATTNNNGPFGQSRGNTISILLGNGDGTFGSKTDYITGQDPRSIALGDLNADGWLDIVTGNFGFETNGNVSVLLSNGNGTFRSKVDYVTASRPASVAIGDLNADGRMDLAVSAGVYGDAALSILLGNGDGSFAPKTDYVEDRSGHVTIADVNGDGHCDVVTSQHVLFGNGSGGFGPIVPHASSGSGVAAGDLNGDGKMDLLSGSTMLLGNGDGTFGTEPLTYEVARAMEQAASVSVCDLNGDGNQDLVIPNYDVPGTVSVVLGHGDGTFGSDRQYVTEEPATSAAVADLNQDGVQDVVVVGEGQEVSVLLGQGDGTLGARMALPIDGLCDGRTKFVAIGDLNADGRSDLAVTGSVTNLFLGNGDGTFRRIVESQSTQASCLAIGDLNGDAKPDLVTVAATYPNGTVSVLLGNGDGTFHTRQDYALDARPEMVTIADLNRDGKQDLVSAGHGLATILLGDGSGGLEPHGGISMVAMEGSYVLRGQLIAVGDLDGDGNQDIAQAGGDGFMVMLGNGDGSFQKGILFGGPMSQAVAIGDLNGDGRPDLVGIGTLMLNIGAMKALSVGLRLDPETVNLGANRRWITATLGVPAPYFASDVGMASLRLNGVAAAVREDADSGRELTVKFEWQAVKDLLQPGDHVAVTITGTVAGRPFTASDEVRVLASAKKGLAAPEAERSDAASFALRAGTVRGSGGRTVRFSLSSAAVATLEVFNVQGRLVDRQEVSSGPGWHSAQLRDLPAGVYLLRLKQAGQSATSRVVMVH
jgi:hypothetical protein